MFADNETCITWSEGSVSGSDRAKHVDLQVRMHFVHEARAAGHLQLVNIEGRLNGADILTKASASPDVFADLRRRLMGHNPKCLCVSQEVQTVARAICCVSQPFCRLGGGMKISDVKGQDLAGLSRRLGLTRRRRLGRARFKFNRLSLVIAV
jgi:hypothetical protein